MQLALQELLKFVAVFDRPTADAMRRIAGNGFPRRCAHRLGMTW